ncbi:anti-anti-sigma factor [Micromonospora siamensis]|uniref:Anti-anti-sigma factor n=1 Tax=Micromonospora siamensis TaxID=299152 RepID=A0A1C5I980_9ACTN|nr:STAS domain-containing protein [Micromonospora siamensis]SCG54296.1 anti-anti-sigma factor [Micromonospora siamensis]
MPRVEIDIVEELALPQLSEVGVAIDRVLSLQPMEVVIDLSECRHVDAAAIGLLLDVRRRLNRRGAVLTIRAPHPRIRRILDTAALDGPPHVVTSPAPVRQPSNDPRRSRPGAVQGRARVAAAEY